MVKDGPANASAKDVLGEDAGEQATAGHQWVPVDSAVPGPGPHAGATYVPPTAAAGPAQNPEPQAVPLQSPPVIQEPPPTTAPKARPAAALQEDDISASPSVLPNGGSPTLAPAATVRVRPPRHQLPGPAAARRVRDRGWFLARRQLVVLLVALVPLVVISLVSYDKVVYRPPTRETNSGSPRFVVEVPARVTSMTFRLTGTSTRISLTLTGWRSRDVPLSIRAERPGQQVQLLELDGTTALGAETTWARTSNTPSQLELLPGGSDDVTGLTVALENGSDSEANQYRYIRTGRVDVVSRSGQLPAQATGELEVDTGSYSIDRLLTEARSEPGVSQGSLTKYSLSTTDLSGVWTDHLPVPAVAVDLVNVQQQRGSDVALLLVGALLGVLGGLLIEIFLTAAHLLLTPSLPNDDGTDRS